MAMEKLKWLGHTPDPRRETSFIVYCGSETVVVSLDGTNWTTMADTDKEDIRNALGLDEKGENTATNQTPAMFVKVADLGHSREKLKVLFTQTDEAEMISRINGSTDHLFVQTLKEVAEELVKLNIVAACEAKLKSLEGLFDKAVKREGEKPKVAEKTETEVKEEVAPVENAESRSSKSKSVLEEVDL